MARRGRGVGRTRYEWTGGLGRSPDLASGATASFLLGTASQAETIMRVRGNVFAEIAATLVDLDACAVFYGIQVMPAGSQAAGLAAGPGTNPEGDWLLFGVVPFYVDTATTVTHSVSMAAREVIDTKAMRVMREGEELLLRVENVDIVGAPPVNFAFGLCILSGE